MRVGRREGAFQNVEVHRLVFYERGRVREPEIDENLGCVGRLG